MVQFDTWLDDLQLYLLSDIKDSVSMFNHVSGAATAPPATTDSATRSLWLSRDAATHLAIRNHLPVAKCAHFGQHRTAQAVYDAVVARYSSPATTALGRLLLPYLFPELSAFATIEDLVSHLRANDARYCTAAPAEFLERNQPPMFITVYFIVTRLPDSLRSVLLVALLARPSLRGAPPPPLPPPTPQLLLQTSLLLRTSRLLMLVRSAAEARARVAGVVEEAAVVEEEAAGVGGGSSGGDGGGGTGGGSGGSGGGGGGSGGSGGSGGGGTGARRVGSGGGQRQQQQRRSEPSRPSSFADLLRSRIAIFDLDFDAILSAMYAFSGSPEGDCYLCVPPDPGIATAALGASESGTLPGTGPAQALHTFTLDSGASACFIRDSTTATPLSAPVPVQMAHPSGGQVVALSSTVLPCPAVPCGSLSGLHLPSFSTNLVSTAALQDAMVTTTIRGGERVSICTCTRTGRHLATFTRRPGLNSSVETPPGSPHFATPSWHALPSPCL
ncbi:unnamed protein product [Closterium sp. NIES-53]